MKLLTTALALAATLASLSAQNHSLRFFGNGTGQIDRVKVPIDTPHRPADVGGDFTIEFWMKGLAAENNGVVTAQADGDGWITGNVIIDRDVFNSGDHGDWGIAVGNNGRIGFGIDLSGNGRTIITGSGNVLDGRWHHVAITRTTIAGEMAIYIDGTRLANGTGPTGDVSYRDGRSTSWPNSDPFIVFGAEKHDAGEIYGGSYPSYSGWLDEVRISNTIRYTGTNFTRPIAPFATDSNTMGLWSFDEGSGDLVGDRSGAAGGPSDGARQFGGSPNAGPLWTTDSPFALHALVDFGGTSYPTTSPDANGRHWNNLSTTGSAAPTGGIAELTNLHGLPTGVSVSVAGFGVGANTSGTTVPDTAALGPLGVASATRDGFFIAPPNTATVTLGGLDPDGLHRITLFASRDAAQTRTSRYSAQGAGSPVFATLQTSGTGIGQSPQPDANRASTAVLENVRPTAGGQITITLSVEAGDFGYLGAWSLERTGTATNPPPPTPGRAGTFYARTFFEGTNFDALEGGWTATGVATPGSGFIRLADTTGTAGGGRVLTSGGAGSAANLGTRNDVHLVLSARRLPEHTAALRVGLGSSASDATWWNVNLAELPVGRFAQTAIPLSQTPAATTGTLDLAAVDRILIESAAGGTLALEIERLFLAEIPTSGRVLIVGSPDAADPAGAVYFSTIQAAVDASGPRDEIRVRPGTYIGSVNLTKDYVMHQTALRILADTAGEVILDGDAGLNASNNFTGHNNGFDFSNSDTSPHAIRANHIEIAGFIVRHFVGMGVGNRNPGHITIRNCLLHSNGVAGIGLNFPKPDTRIRALGNLCFLNGWGEGWAGGIHLNNKDTRLHSIALDLAGNPVPADDDPGHEVIGNIAFLNLDESEYNSDGNGIMIDFGGGSEALVSDNLAFLNAGAGIRNLNGRVTLLRNIIYRNGWDHRAAPSAARSNNEQVGFLIRHDTSVSPSLTLDDFLHLHYSQFVRSTMNHNLVWTASRFNHAGPFFAYQNDTQQSGSLSQFALDYGLWNLFNGQLDSGKWWQVQYGYRLENSTGNPFTDDAIGTPNPNNPSQTLQPQTRQTNLRTTFDGAASPPFAQAPDAAYIPPAFQALYGHPLRDSQGDIITMSEATQSIGMVWNSSVRKNLSPKLTEVRARPSLDLAAFDFAIAPSAAPEIQACAPVIQIDPAYATIFNTYLRREFDGNNPASGIPYQKQSPPTATAVAWEGAPRAGSTLQGRYFYHDADGDAESGTTVQWERSATPSGSGTPITGATDLTYTPTATDLGEYLRLVVTPAAATGASPGAPVASEWHGPIGTSDSLTVYHIGNSFTRWGDVPAQVGNFAAARAQPHLWGNQLRDGEGLAYHWANGLPGGTWTRGTPSRTELATATWDALVIQPMSREFLPANQSSFLAHADLFDNLADANGTQLFLYAYWPYLSEPLSLQDDISAAFESVRAQLSADGPPVHIIPVGEAFRRVTEEVAAGTLTGITRADLYQDDYHPSDTGYYLASLVHYATLYQQSPVGLPATGISADPNSSAPVTISAALAAELQRIAWQVARALPASGITRGRFDTWATANLPPGQRTPTDIPYNDGITNLARWAFGIPISARSGVGYLPAIATATDGKIEISYQLGSDAEDVGILIEELWSTDLQSWNAPPPPGLTRTRSGQTITLRLPDTPTRYFFRCRVQEP